MRIESCRKCGIELELKQKCSICNDPLKFTCKKCQFESEEQIHVQCRLIDMNYKQQPDTGVVA